MNIALSEHEKLKPICVFLLCEADGLYWRSTTFAQCRQ